MPISQLVGTSSTNAKCKTFVFNGEGHTLGNALQCICLQDPNVEFCGYTVPHPLEGKMNIRIQVKNGRAVDALINGLENLVQISDHILQSFEVERLRHEAQIKPT